MRPRNWVKNLIIGLPLVLSYKFTMHTTLNFIIGFCCFSLVASGGYIINDIKDIEKDRMHPQKRFRPLASGDVKIDTSFRLAIY